MVSAVPLAALARPALACAEWCEDDPPITLTCPDGEKIHAFVTLYGRSSAFSTFAEQKKYLQPDLKRATVQSSSRDAGDGAVEFTVAVHIPNDEQFGSFETQIIVSSRPMGGGTQYARVSGGSSGRPQELRFPIAHP